MEGKEVVVEPPQKNSITLKTPSKKTSFHKKEKRIKKGLFDIKPIKTPETSKKTKKTPPRKKNPNSKRLYGVGCGGARPTRPDPTPPPRARARGLTPNLPLQKPSISFSEGGFLLASAFFLLRNNVNSIFSLGRILRPAPAPGALPQN